VDYLQLLIAVLLPWLTGFFWLAAAARRYSSEGANITGQIGYGLFLGYASLQGIALAFNSIAGEVRFLPILSILALVTVIGGLLFTSSRTMPPRNTTAGYGRQSQPGRLHQMLFWLFVSWTTAHLLLVAIEIVYRPIFPWDAWLNWMYRAKAWFYSGHIFAMEQSADWLRDGSGYNVAATHYPTFAPVLALWAALALGYWSETLVNLPVLCCSVALGLAFYGQCREYGLGKWPSALGAYLLLSIPLVDTHLSLGGMSDIWMVGFTGLGFVALLHGLIRDRPAQLVLGLGMTAIGIAVKLEGTVWLLAALLTLGLARHTGKTILLLLALACAAGIGWALGITHLDLPVLGQLGVVEGRMHIPLLGSYDLQSFDLWDDYRDNFFSSGTWNLLWILIMLGAACLKLLPAGSLRRTILAFYGVLLFAQLFIFEATETGQWAEDWTAINRLPLHFTPALVFSLVVVGQALLEKTWPSRERLAGGKKILLAAPLAGLLIAMGGGLAYLLLSYPLNPESAGKHFTGREMHIVVGGGRQTKGADIVESYQNNIAIVSSGPLMLDTSQYGLVRIETVGASRSRAAFFWRNGNGPDDLHSTELTGGGIHWINLDDQPDWQGIVSELGMIFFSNNGEAVEFHAIRLAPHSVQGHLTKLIRDWQETATWSQKSVNWLPAGAVTSTLHLPALMCAWILATVLVALAAARHNRGACASVLVCAVAAWLVLDIRWTANSLAQSITTVSAFAPASASYLDFGDDDFTGQLVETARPWLTQAGARVLIVAENKNMNFQALRAKYHALPAAAFVYEGKTKDIPLDSTDYILFLKQRHTAPDHQTVSASVYARRIGRRHGVQAIPVLETDEGFLLAVTPGKHPAKAAR